jgi:hypothetical protein
MTTTSREAKGLKAVLKEHGFDVSCLRAKCSPVCPVEKPQLLHGQAPLSAGGFY